MARALASYLHRPLDIENMPFEGLIPALKTGRIDLIFRWEGKLYLADWKTNRLPPGEPPGGLMAEAGYDLQAQWYWEALTRLCRPDQGDLEPGGVLYIFLRGSGDTPLGHFMGPGDLDRNLALQPYFEEASHG